MTFEFSYSWINGVKFWKTETRITGLFYMLGNMFYSRRNFLDLLEGEKRKRKTPPMMVILPVCQSCRITNGRKIFIGKNRKILNWRGGKHLPYVTGKWCSVSSAFCRQQTPSTSEVTVTVSCTCSPHVFQSLCHLHHRTGHLLGWTAVVWSTNLHPKGDGVG